MPHDLVIRGGMVVDGTGAPATIADVAIDGDLVVEVGRVEGTGQREIDAEGRVVTPGFVDIHTHLDAQLSWDPIGSSSCWHGVTSVVLGNCGVTFAPVAPGGREFLAEMMESVEDIPAECILGGLSWNWETYGEYLAEVALLPKGVNAGGMVGHCAVRVAAMGERSLDEDPATAEDIAAMVPMVDEALATQFADAMLDKGVYVVGFSYPVVPQGKARIRTQISAGHSREDLTFAIERFGEVKSELEI